VINNVSINSGMLFTPMPLHCIAISTATPWILHGAGVVVVVVLFLLLLLLLLGSYNLSIIAL